MKVLQRIEFKEEESQRFKKFFNIKLLFLGIGRFQLRCNNPSSKILLEWLSVQIMHLRLNGKDPQTLAYYRSS